MNCFCRADVASLSPAELRLPLTQLINISDHLHQNLTHLLVSIISNDQTITTGWAKKTYCLICLMVTLRRLMLDWRAMCPKFPNFSKMNYIILHICVFEYSLRNLHHCTQNYIEFDNSKRVYSVEIQ